ncbi:hypothetical protein K450DRAFT_248203 [Umbelopsis ramanniana AG]|uniref:Uncharacterized protein n=1 Tax=Umbelopsis ramanniana AG TaxID=1314678 RepID=A0AAD5E9U9_UMBRA|nr:uncharacterized protein K450DRAFT_248203 [Umbelopsis ramanniana AG]KAI8578305.1 hypothetical protein K450DRAFT_248203 [Umbelopsis ramanniana AG]
MGIKETLIEKYTKCKACMTHGLYRIRVVYHNFGSGSTIISKRGVTVFIRRIKESKYTTTCNRNIPITSSFWKTIQECSITNGRIARPFYRSDRRRRVCSAAWAPTDKIMKGFRVGELHWSLTASVVGTGGILCQPAY